MKIRIATTERSDRFHHYIDVVQSEPFEWLGTIKAPFCEVSLKGVDAFICSCEYHWEARLAIAACKRIGIPTFHVLDGIIEWRNVFENPRSVDKRNGTPLFQPLLSDVTFTMGEVQKRVLQWLGNDARKMIVTGFPRMDAIASRRCRFGSVAGVAKLLVATANTPWFTNAQKELFLDQFGRLIEQLDEYQERLGYQTTWRVAESVESNFDIKNTADSTAVSALSDCDVLITTPSSLMIEAMLMGIPTLVFDPYHVPAFFFSVWSAGNAESVMQLLPSLLAPSCDRAAIQDAMRMEMTPHDQGASVRMIETIVERVKESPSEIVIQKTSKDSSVTMEESHTALAELQGLVDTIPSLDRMLIEKQEQIEVLLHERKRPSIRYVLGCMYRSVARLWSKVN